VYANLRRHDQNIRTGVPLLCHRLRPDQMKLGDLALSQSSFRAGWTEVIEVYSDYSLELL
jgi:hypothetical protein